MCYSQFFLIKLLTLGILSSTVLRAVVVTKLVISDILFLISFILALRAVVVANLVIRGIYLLTSFILTLRHALVANFVVSGILSSKFLTLALYISFLTASLFTKSVSFLKSTGTHTTFLFKLLKLFGTFFNLSISNLSTSDFTLAESTF